MRGEKGAGIITRAWLSVWIRMGKKILSCQICTSNLWKHVCTLSPGESAHKNAERLSWKTARMCFFGIHETLVCAWDNKFPNTPNGHCSHWIREKLVPKNCSQGWLPPTHPHPGLALRRELAHDLTCFSSFSCWNADSCSIFGGPPLDGRPNVTRGINPKDPPIEPEHLRDKEVDYCMCVFAQLLQVGGRRLPRWRSAVSNLLSPMTVRHDGDRRCWYILAHRFVF